ncbi:hypothetical protein [Streptomyces sp. NPDC005955]|uniref:hypothetical protein n=1 Tax=Streptomyces sp. NPDC005955 TaxID=3364738 RepID=UPI0036B5DA84
MTQPVAPTAPTRYKIGLTFKAAPGYDAEWITPTVYGVTADEVAVNAVALMKALADKGVIDLAALAAKKVRDTHRQSQAATDTTPKTFQNGKVQEAPAAAVGDCPHGRTLREGQGAKGSWAALFCNAPKGAQCDPLWRQKDGNFA